MTNILPQDWLFMEPQNLAVFTTEAIVSGNHPILYVSHDIEDDSWQFLSGKNISKDTPKIIALRTIVKLDQSILELADLPSGWIAIRKTKDDCWQRYLKVRDSTSNDLNA
ncbi:hypothetical protein [Pseudanabaena sp. UWO310]|uniref:hypothetical protein n=1 Tax=Pseudanabaena sp. UWO310 TaxID=2480795 RepID=UPI00115C3B15|nr:hypothetical protein [Pseudanabaena sp. UWO310]TYQ27273.1 hypothetical protein PseudUWO310_16105 [Pseudanabaena sp. UWO310]